MKVLPPGQKRMAVAAAKPKAPAKKKPPAKKPGTTQAGATLAAAAPISLADQQLSEAAKIAALSIDPAKADIVSAIAAAERARLNQTRQSEGIMRALAELGAGDAEQARAAYADSAKLTGQYAQGFSGQLRGMQEGKAAQANDLISRLGLAGRVESSGAQNADTLNMTGGVIPGENLASMAPLALQQAQGRRLAAGARLADNASMSDYKAGQGIEGIRAEIAKLEQKRPGLVMEALADIRQQANATRATNTQIGYLQLQQAKTVQDRAIAMTNLTGTIHIVVGKGPKAKVVDTGRAASGSDATIAATKAATSTANAQASAAAKTAAAATAAEAKRDVADIAARAKLAAARITANKKTVSTTKNRLDAETKFRTLGRETALQLAGFNAKAGRPLQRPPTRVSLMKAVYNSYGASLVGKYGITKAEVEAWAHQIVMAFPNAWWDPRTYTGTGGGVTVK